MSLSEQEQRALREIEQSLLAEDPKFGSSVAQEVSFGGERPAGKLTLRSVALMVLGLVLLLGGVALASVSVWMVALSIVGFGVMMAGGVMALRTPSTPTAHVQPQRGAKQRSQRGASLEESFRRRFEDRQ
ncbi:hypothetical membrane protein [Corynebacterium imitans]|uniref:Membrane protein n=1 Tax=Corynebacterium imitans TaxID=156978 RepID=A0A076NHD5_9CORY|nr:DUF3040 domain-containing protein [Corynebacterium imitans]AIJ33894.1 membrane protein [Corynebacterium imitans]MCG7277781.1 DUF3040 domain-containing protein [Corynebacterium imitans]SNV76751.1 hypothetical membrane protein [Corynebacterium imitans]